MANVSDGSRLCVVREWILEKWRAIMLVRQTGSDPRGLALCGQGKGVHFILKAMTGIGKL